MKRLITLAAEQEHIRDVQITTGRTWHEMPGIEISVTFTPEPKWAELALGDFDAKVADIRRGIAAYVHVGEGQR